MRAALLTEWTCKRQTSNTSGKLTYWHSQCGMEWICMCISGIDWCVEWGESANVYRTVKWNAWGTQSNNSHWNEEKWERDMKQEDEHRERQVEKMSRKTNERQGWEIEGLSERKGHRSEFMEELAYSLWEKEMYPSQAKMCGRKKVILSLCTFFIIPQ